MKSRWLGLALLAAGALAESASGQYTSGLIPTPVGAARLPDPTPIGQPQPNCQQPPLMQGPISPCDAPPGPPPDLQLPVGHTSAFQCEPFPPETGIYFHVGALLLQRQQLLHDPLGVEDVSDLKNGVFNSDGTLLLDANGQPEHGLVGPKATIGCLMGSEAVELTGFYLAPQRTNQTVTEPGQIDGFFFNPPLGFEGDNGLWLHSDLMSVQQSTQLFGAEFNYRYSNPGVEGPEIIIGVRYMDFLERLDFYTGDDDLTFLNKFGMPDPVREATYSSQTHNRVVAPQIGFEYAQQWKFLAIGVEAKAAVGPNFVETTHKLFRGDGFEGFDVSRNDVTWASQIYDANAYLEFDFTDRCKIHAAYNFLWLVNVNLAENQVNFDLSQPQGKYNSHGSVFFQGPSLEIQFLF